MSGHSHWARIKHKKSTVDQRRGKEFSKHVKAIMVAARGGSDPDANLRLRYAIDDARRAGVPRDTIDRAAKKGAGELEGQSLQEIVYEGYGPGAVAMMVQTLTDKSSRTAPEVRRIFEGHGGRMGAAGSTAWMFRRKGLFSIAGDAVGEDRLIEIALDAGADDVRPVDGAFEIHSPAERFDAVMRALEGAGLAPDVRELVWLAENELAPDVATQVKNLSLMADLEEHEDVQSVYAAFTPSVEALDEYEKARP